MTNNININLPKDLATEVNALIKDTGWSKKELVTQALRQFIAIKIGEGDFRSENPGSRVTTTVTYKAQKGDAKNMASVLIY